MKNYFITLSIAIFTWVSVFSKPIKPNIVHFEYFPGNVLIELDKYIENDSIEKFIVYVNNVKFDSITFRDSKLFLEENGIVKIEAEEFSPLGWTLLNTPKGFTGKGFLSSINFNRVDASTEWPILHPLISENETFRLKYKIFASGLYRIDMMNYHDKKDGDNDCWINFPSDYNYWYKSGEASDETASYDFLNFTLFSNYNNYKQGYGFAKVAARSSGFGIDYFVIHQTKSIGFNLSISKEMQDSVIKAPFSDYQHLLDVSSLKSETIYNIYIQSVNKKGEESESSNIISFKTTKDSIPPVAPIIFEVIPAETKTLVKWSKPYDNVAIAGYKVFVNQVLYNNNALNFSESISIDSLIPSTNYVVKIKAVDVNGLESNYSSITIFKTLPLVNSVSDKMLDPKVQITNSNTLIINSGFTEKYTVKILNSQGNLISTFNSNESIFVHEINYLTKGIYIIIMQSGDIIKSTKIIK